MISENTIQLINKIASKKTFKYTGEIIHGVNQPANIDYKFQITGHRKMMSVGEYYDYLLLEVVIIGVHDPISKLIFTPEPTETGNAIARMYESKLYRFYSSLNQEIQDYLTYFKNPEEEFVRTTIDDLKFDFKNITESSKLNLENNKTLHKFVSKLEKPLIESKMGRMSKVAVRTTVKDIVYKLKDGKEGEFRLPDVDDGSEYSFTNLPFGYSVDLSINIDDNIDGFKIESYYIWDEDVIEIFVSFNPKTLKKDFYDIIGELNDIVAHELEHGFQYYTGEHTYRQPSKKSLKYYTSPKEVGAQRVGFRRVAKLRKLPFNDVVKDWFENHKDIHGLTENEIEKVSKIILDGK